MQPSSLDNSGRSARSGRSGRSVRSEEEAVKGRKKVVMELKKVGAERDGWIAVKRTAVECSGRSGSGLEKVVERRQKLKVAAEKEKAEKEKKDRMWKELLEQKKREKRERKARMEKQMEKQLAGEMKECEKQSEECRKVWKMSVEVEEEGWTSVKGRRVRRSVESSVLSEEEFPSLEKEKKEKEMKEKVRKECFEKKRRERLAREEKKREEKMKKKLEEEKKELEKQRAEKKQKKVQLKREKEERGSERRMAAGFKRARKQSSEERVVEKIMLDNLLLEPEQKRRRSGRSGRSSEGGERKLEKVESDVLLLEPEQKRRRRGRSGRSSEGVEKKLEKLESMVDELECGIVVDELDESVIVCRSIVDEMIEGIGVLLNGSVQCQVNEIVGYDLDCWVSLVRLNVDESEGSESEGPVLEEETVCRSIVDELVDELDCIVVDVCRSMVDEIVEIAVGVSEGTSDFFNVDAQIAKMLFQGVEHCYQPSDSEEEQSWDQYVDVGVGDDEVGVDEVGVGVGVDEVGVGVDEVGVSVGVGVDEVGVSVGDCVDEVGVGVDEVGVSVGVGVDEVGVGVGVGDGVDEVGVGVGPEQEEYWVEDSNGFRARVFPCHDCLIEYNTLDGLQEHICLPNMLPHFLFRNDTPDVTATQSPSLVPTKTRISCAIIGCDTTFARKDAMLRHVRNLHKISKDHPCYPGNKKLNPVEFLDVVFEGGDPEPAPQDQDTADDDDDVVIGDEGGDPEPAPQDQDTADDDDDVVIGDEGGDPELATQDTADDDDVVLGDEGGDPEPAQVQDIAAVEPALEPRRPTFISDEFKECLRTVFEELPGKLTSQQIIGKIQENRELQTYWEEFLQVNKSRSKAVDTVKKFLGGSRQVNKGYMDPAIEDSLWALLTPDSVLTTKALVKRAAEDEQFKVVWDYFRSRRKTASDAAKWLRRTALRKP